MSKGLSDSINELSEVTKKYIQTRIELVKLTVLSKTSQITAYLIGNLILTLLGALILFFLLVAFIVWYGQLYNDYLTGLLLAIIFLVLLFILFVLLKNRILTPLILRHYSTMLFEDEEEEGDEV